MRPFLFLLLLALPAWCLAGQDLPAGLLDVWKTDWTERIISLSELAVNVPRDAIPAIDNPSYTSMDEASKWLAAGEPVISLVVNGEARAFPLQILIWHELVNDRIAEIPVTVTFCPLCYSAIAFDRRFDGDVLEFGVSGMLRLSDLVMYDRDTHSLWQQLSGEAIVGERAGQKLDQIPTQIISLAQFREAYPDGRVLDRPQGTSRPYGTNPYVGYDNVDERPWLFNGKLDERIRPMEKVVAVELNGELRAYPHSRTREAGVVNDVLGGVPLVIFHDALGASSALDAAVIAESRDLGSTGVFLPRLDGQVLDFMLEDGAFVDRQTGSVWTITGEARSGPLKGAHLDRISHGDFFAFAWLAAFPKTSVYSR